jgi:DNA-binding sugar fermentation-stimulating protein
VPSRLYWRETAPVVGAVELMKCWVVDRLCGTFPDTPTDRAIRERGDRHFADDHQTSEQ